ncbi:MAG: tetratricopeptide repeat protein [Phycisphaerales bacterium]|nr:MAG: tetratricopeptide repeat protein [Phycisphaerales bacterium]
MYDPFYRWPYYDTHYSQVSIYNYDYEPLTSTIPEQTVVYTESAPSTVPAVVQAYPATPAQQADTIVEEPQDVATVEPPAEEGTSWVELGNTAFMAGRYDEARHLYMRAILGDGEDGFAKLFYGLANFARGDYGAAVTAIRRGLEDVPELIDNPIDLRAFYADEITLDAQLAALTTLVETHAGDREARFLLGYLLYATGKPDKAAETLEPIADTGSTDIMAVFVRDAALRVVRSKELDGLTLDEVQ